MTIFNSQTCSTSEQKGIMGAYVCMYIYEPYVYIYFLYTNINKRMWELRTEAAPTSPEKEKDNGDKEKDNRKDEKSSKRHR